MKPLSIVAVVAAAALSACATVHTDDSLGFAQTHAALEQRIGLAVVTVPDGAFLRGASIDGHPAFCTIEAAYFIVGETGRAICLIDNEQTGYFDAAYVLGTIRSMMLRTAVPYTVDTKEHMVNRFLLDQSYRQELIRYDYYRSIRAQ
jgi:hypothetical protein